MKRKVIIDCDPGHDDAVALVLAVGTAELEVIGVTVAAGNSSLENTVRNARNILTFAGARDIPVYAGCERPLKRPLLNETGAKIHGGDGMGDYRFPVKPAPVQEENAVVYLADTLYKTKDKITLVCLGPLTNIAAAFERCPECRNNVEEIVIMGGAVYVPGNVTPAAEFNFYIDPEAANAVIKSGCRIRLNPLDVTMQALFYREDIERIGKTGGKTGKFVSELLTLYAGSYEKELGFYACPVHDALCIGVLAEPSIVAYENMEIYVETVGCEAGRSVAGQKGGNTWFGKWIDRDRFVEFVTETIVRQDEK